MICSPSEIDPRLRGFPNVLIAKDHLTTLEQDLALIEAASFHLGAASGPSTIAQFNRKPYCIFGWKISPGLFRGVTRDAHRYRFCFSTELQNWIVDEETTESLIAEFERIMDATSGAAWSARRQSGRQTSVFATDPPRVRTSSSRNTSGRENFRINEFALGIEQPRPSDPQYSTGKPNYPEGAFSGLRFLGRPRRFPGIPVIRAPLIPRGSDGARSALPQLSLVCALRQHPGTVSLPWPVRRHSRLPAVTDNGRNARALAEEAQTRAHAVLGAGSVARKPVRYGRNTLARAVEAGRPTGSADLSELRFDTCAVARLIEPIAGFGTIVTNRVLPNSADEPYRRSMWTRTPHDACACHRLPGKFAGNIGAAQDFGTISMRRSLKGEPIYVDHVGDGAAERRGPRAGPLAPPEQRALLVGTGGNDAAVFRPCDGCW